MQTTSSTDLPSISLIIAAGQRIDDTLALVCELLRWRLVGKWIEFGTSTPLVIVDGGSTIASANRPDCNIVIGINKCPPWTDSFLNA